VNQNAPINKELDGLRRPCFGLQGEGEIIDAFLAAQHQKDPLFTSQKTLSDTPPECLITYVPINTFLA
jgi:hypothetical protein